VELRQCACACVIGDARVCASGRPWMFVGSSKSSATVTARSRCQGYYRDSESSVPSLYRCERTATASAERVAAHPLPSYAPAVVARRLAVHARSHSMAPNERSRATTMANTPSDLKHDLHCGFVELGGSVSVSSKSDLRNHQAIVQPRLYDCLMVTQITLNTEPHGFDSCQGHSVDLQVKVRSTGKKQSVRGKFAMQLRI
jgi:hypothetical protein